MDKDLKESSDYKSLLDGLEKISVMPCQEMVRNNNDIFIHGVSAVAMSAVRALKAENEQLKSGQEQNPHCKSHGMKKDEVIWSVFMVIACAIAICSGCRYTLEVIDGNRYAYFFQGIMLVVNLCIGFCYLKRLITLDVIPKNKENEEGGKNRMKKRSINAVFEFFQRDDETDEEMLKVVKGCIECSIGHVEEIKIADTDSINQAIGTKKSPMHPLKEPSGDMFSRAWWFKCPVCHQAIDYQQRMCDLCFQPINWDGEQGQWG